MARPMCVLPQPGGPWIEWKLEILLSEDSKPSVCQWPSTLNDRKLSRYGMFQWLQLAVIEFHRWCWWPSWCILQIQRMLFVGEANFPLCRNIVGIVRWWLEIIQLKIFKSAIAWCLIHWRITKAYININNVVFHWKCFLCEWFQHTVNMTIGLKIDVTLTHYEVLMKNRCYIVGVDDFDLNLKKVFREC